MRKTPGKARRQGQRQGQTKLTAIAAEHGVSEDFVRLIATGSLIDPLFVGALRRASRKPDLWKLVAPSVREYLFRRELDIAKLGGTRDDLIALYQDSHRHLRHPINRSYAEQLGVLRHVDESLAIRLEDNHQERVHALERARAKALADAKEAARKGAAKKREKSRAAIWLNEVEARKPGSTKSQKYLEIALRENLDPDAVKQAVVRLARELRASPIS